MSKTPSIFYVYMLFRMNGIPCYVGKGKNDRWRRHHGRSRHYNKHLGSIIDQAKIEGKELPRVKVAENLTEEDAFRLEKILIGMIGRHPHGPLVNLTDGGDGPSGYCPSPELIERQAATRRGKTITSEHRAKISAAMKGKPKSSEHAAKVAAANRGKTKKNGWWSTEDGRAKQRANNPGNKGKRHSEATKELIRAARIRQKNVSTIGQFKKRSINEGDFR